MNPNHGPKNHSWCGPKTHSYLGPMLWFNHGTHIPLVSERYPTGVPCGGLRICSCNYIPEALWIVDVVHGA
jgi:hypothetical protein